MNVVLYWTIQLNLCRGTHRRTLHLVSTRRTERRDTNIELTFRSPTPIGTHCYSCRAIVRVIQWNLLTVSS